MQFSAHCCLWTDKWSNDGIATIDRAASLGLDAIEITMRDLGAVDASAIKQRLTSAGIKGLCLASLPPNADLASSDATERAAGVRLLEDTVAKAAAIGSKLVTGVIYTTWNRPATGGPTEDEINWSAEGLRKVARFAQNHGVTLGVEAVNRYETYFLNTASQALQLVDLIGEPNVGVHLDTFHMGLEEKSMAEAVRKAGSKLVHLHVIENDRGIPGTGLVAWDPLFAALAETRYTGFAGFETFLIVAPHLAKVTHIWRKLAPDGDTLVRQGLAFLRGKAQMHRIPDVV